LLIDLPANLIYLPLTYLPRLILKRSPELFYSSLSSLLNHLCAVSRTSALHSQSRSLSMIITRRALVTLLFSLFLCITVSAQTPTPTPRDTALPIDGQPSL